MAYQGEGRSLQSGRFPLAVFACGLAFLTVWTVGVQLATSDSMPFGALYGVLALASIAAFLGARFSPALGSLFFESGLQLPTLGIERPAATFRNRKRLLAIAGLGILYAVMAVVQHITKYFPSNFTPFYVVCLASSVLALALSRNEESNGLIEMRSPAPGERAAPALTLVVLVMGLMLAFYFFTSLSDLDDSLFLNLAVGAKRARDALFATDTMLGIPGLPFFKSTYRLESYQLLAAVISDLSGLSVIHAAHSVIPAMMCVFGASVLVLIHAALFPKRWFLTVLFHIAWVTALDGRLQTYGYHGIWRFFQGKGPFVTVMVPLIALLTAIAVNERKTLALPVLGCAQIVSLGFTANAIYAGPLTSALVAAPMFLLGDHTRRVGSLKLILTVAYPAALAAIIVAFHPPEPSQNQFSAPIGVTLWSVFGTSYAHAGGLLLMFVAASAAWLDRRLRLVSLYTMIFLAVVLNPVTWQAYGRFVTGEINDRLFWAVPIPLVLAILSGLAWAVGRYTIRILLVAVIAVALLAPGSILRKVHWGLSFRKVPEPTYAIATKINTLWPGDGLILAPEEISAWITTLDDGGPVVEARGIYIPQRRKQLPPEQYALRQMLFNWVSDKRGDGIALEEVFNALRALDVRVVATKMGSQAQELLEQRGPDIGFNRSIGLEGYRVFVR